jgi:hypothetical protein
MERLKPILKVVITAFALYELSFLAFSKELKEQVRKEQGGRCDWCGEKVGKLLQIHHIIPQRMRREKIQEKMPLGYVKIVIGIGTNYHLKKYFMKRNNNTDSYCPYCHQKEVVFKKVYKDGDVLIHSPNQFHICQN